MTGSKGRRLNRARIVIILIIIAMVITGWRAWTHFRQRQHAKTTAHRIRVLSSILQGERPGMITDANLDALVAKYGRPEVLADPWGRRLRVELDGSRYVVSSAGRDGVFTGCCVTREKATPDTDLIAVDGEWKQVWN